MKALLNRRRLKGLPASSVDISRVVGVGYVDRELRIEGRLSKEQKDRLVTGSMSLPMSESDLHQAFAEAIVAGRPGSRANPEVITGIASVSVEEANMNLWPGNPKFGLLVRVGDEQVIESDDQGNNLPVKKLLEEAQSMEELRQIVKGTIYDVKQFLIVANHVADAFGARLRSALFFSPSDDLPEEKPLVDLGVDSLVGVEIRSWCMKELGVDLPVMKILGGDSVTDIADHLLANLSNDLASRFSAPQSEKADSVTQSQEKLAPMDVGVDVKSPQVTQVTVEEIVGIS